MNSPRRFNLRQRRALYLAANGRCERCGDELEEGWHADHVIPHSKGGATTIDNGQALCPDCNQTKSDTMPDKFQSDIFGRPPHPEPLDWQRRAVRRFASVDGPFLADATPGSGKTAFAAYLYRRYYGSRWEQIFVVTNSQQRRKGWIQDLGKFGIALMKNWAGRDRRPTVKDYHGGVMTYDILPGNVHDLRALTKRPTLVVFDEIHHLGDQMSWGDAAQQAFGHDSVEVVGLTGTPFRSDNHRIPFVPYERDGDELVSSGHVGYDYGDALKDGVLRYVHFRTYDGEMSWVGRDGQNHEASFSEDIRQHLYGERLRTAVLTKRWVLPQIREADRQLQKIRTDVKPDAGGLIVASNVRHAHEIAGWMQDEMGRDPLVVTSDRPNAHDAIDDFKDSRRRWVVAVQMISEGVNIKRLRVGVYASNYTAPLFLHQVIGRVLRGPNGYSYFWLPADPRIKEVVSNIREMRDHVIEEEEEEGDGGPGNTSPSLYLPEDAELGSYEDLGPLFDEMDNMRQSDLEDLPAKVLAAYIKKTRGASGDGLPSDSASTTNGQSGPTKWEQEKDLRKRIQDRATQYAAERRPRLYKKGGKDRGVAIAKAHKIGNRHAGISDTDTATMEELKQKLEFYENRL